MSPQLDNDGIYNEAVPMEFTRALLAQARAHDRDVEQMLRDAGFPFDPLRQHLYPATAQQSRRDVKPERQDEYQHDAGKKPW